MREKDSALLNLHPNSIFTLRPPAFIVEIAGHGEELLFLAEVGLRSRRVRGCREGSTWHRSFNSSSDGLESEFL